MQNLNIYQRGEVESSCSSLFSGLRDKFRMACDLSFPVQTWWLIAIKYLQRIAVCFLFLWHFITWKLLRNEIYRWEAIQARCLRKKWAAIVVSVELPNKNLFDCDFWVIPMLAVSFPQSTRFYWLLICEKNKKSGLYSLECIPRDHFASNRYQKIFFAE